MKILKISLGSIGVLIALLLIIPIFTQKKIEVERVITINKPKEQVFEYVKLLKNQIHYSSSAKKDPNTKMTYTGTDGTVGFIAKWTSEIEDVSVGEQKIKKIIDGQRIDFELRFIEPYQSTHSCYMSTDAITKNSTKVKWGIQGDMPYPMNLMLVFFSDDDMYGKHFEEGLVNLKNILEK